MNSLYICRDKSTKELIGYRVINGNYLRVVTTNGWPDMHHYTKREGLRHTLINNKPQVEYRMQKVA